MSQLADLLRDMAQDADLEAAWKKDKEAVMARYKLTDEEMQALRDGDVEALKRLSGIANIKANSSVKAHDG